MIPHERYFDKVHGCFLGKCAGGNVGVPYEGMKQLMNLTYDAKMTSSEMFNDDLDLQVLWLDVLEEKGSSFTAGDLADAFLSLCPYAPGEYASFKRNYAKKILPPACGNLNMGYYKEGMGSPIRAEIWGCVSPGNPALAADMAEKDGSLDHCGNSVYAERYFAALIASAFLSEDLDSLVIGSLSFIPETSRLRSLILDVRRWCGTYGDWKQVRSFILRDYGHPDCTNLFQNIGFVLLSLYFGETDFAKTVMTALNCGYDTDCTCGMAASVLGTILGADRMIRETGLREQSYVLGVAAKPRSDKVRDLAADICKVGRSLADSPPLPRARLEIQADYLEKPAAVPGKVLPVAVTVRNHGAEASEYAVSVRADNSLTVTGAPATVRLPAGGEARFELGISADGTAGVSYEQNLVTLTLTAADGTAYSSGFGVAGTAPWLVIGPFIENRVTLPDPGIGENYYSFFDRGDDLRDRVREYHLDAVVNIHKEHVYKESIYKALEDGEPEALSAFPTRIAYLPEDRFSFDDVIGYQGPCALYMARSLVCPDDRLTDLRIGHSDAFSLWVNGALIASDEGFGWWTGENTHVLGLPLKKGVNTIIVKLARRGASADFSLTFLEHSGNDRKPIDFPRHFHDLGTKRPPSALDRR
ncbi:MAG: ADP-ribosylglycohydrolase family protein [Oscillospiraceae bacterium]|jgi:ADP-ribosylglycohydrolase|nr:ADP-ribosylglycohydrolase family protein [Oscillospiraceae bacterium]